MSQTPWECHFGVGKWLSFFLKVHTINKGVACFCFSFFFAPQFLHKINLGNLLVSFPLRFDFEDFFALFTVFFEIFAQNIPLWLLLSIAIPMLISTSDVAKMWDCNLQNANCFNFIRFSSIAFHFYLLQTPIR